MPMFNNIKHHIMYFLQKACSFHVRAGRASGLPWKQFHNSARERACHVHAPSSPLQPSVKLMPALVCSLLMTVLSSLHRRSWINVEHDRVDAGGYHLQPDGFTPQ